jgi:catechol 2,3-dioxygenase-like lactoylglutathione lyase family enzyme
MWQAALLDSGLRRNGGCPTGVSTPRHSGESRKVDSRIIAGAKMARVKEIDHLAVRVSDYERSKDFYGRLFSFLGFEISDEYEDAIGWTNGKTRFWIGPADAEGRKRKYRLGDIGFHHYAFQLRSRKDVDELQRFLQELGATIVDPAAEYYDDYYAVFFLDPDGLKLEGMKYGERHAQAARKSTSSKKVRRKSQPRRRA